MKTVFEDSLVVSEFKPTERQNNVFTIFLPLAQTLGRNIMYYINAYIVYKYSSM